MIFFEEHFSEWCTGGPWFNETICWNLHGNIFEELFVTARQDRYKLKGGLHDNEKINYKSTDATIFGGGIPIPDNSTTSSLVSIYVSINLIYTWLNVSAKKKNVELLCLSREYEINI